jgi:hypothetical protein
VDERDLRCADRAVLSVHPHQPDLFHPQAARHAVRLDVHRFGVFILACGATHVADIWVVWKPDYVLSVTLKAITAVASVVTAIAMIRLIPIALRIPSPAQLAAVNAELQKPTTTCAPRWSAPKWPTAPRVLSWPR